MAASRWPLGGRRPSPRAGRRSNQPGGRSARGVGGRHRSIQCRPPDRQTGGRAPQSDGGPTVGQDPGRRAPTWADTRPPRRRRSGARGEGSRPTPTGRRWPSRTDHQSWPPAETACPPRGKPSRSHRPPSPSGPGGSRTGRRQRSQPRPRGPCTTRPSGRPVGQPSVGPPQPTAAWQRRVGATIQDRRRWPLRPPQRPTQQPPGAVRGQPGARRAGEPPPHRTVAGPPGHGNHRWWAWWRDLGRPPLACPHQVGSHQ